VRRRVLIAASLLALTVVGAALARDPRAEQVRLKPADVALAKRIAIHVADLGAGWRKQPIPAGEDARMKCPEVNPNFSRFTITGKARSAFVEQTTTQAISSIEVYESRSDAVGDFRLGAKPELAKCLRREIERELSTSGLPMRVVSARVVPAPRVGENRIAYRVVARVETAAAKASIYADVIVFQRGRSIAVLSFTAPFKPYAREAKVAAAVASRMR
jgi:hypothetical protein